jgi:hypothetical protein
MCLDQDSTSSSPGKHRELATGRGIAAQGGDGHRGRDRPAGFRPRRPTRPRLPPEGHQTHPFLAQGQGTQGKPTRGSPRCCPPGWGRTWASAAGSTGRSKTAVSRGRRRGEAGSAACSSSASVARTSALGHGRRFGTTYAYFGTTPGSGPSAGATVGLLSAMSRHSRFCLRPPFVARGDARSVYVEAFC